MFAFGVLVFISILLAGLSVGKLATESEVPSHVISLEGVSGGVARLPCDILPPPLQAAAQYNAAQPDKLLLVIWYKEGIPTPIYSMDARGRPLPSAKHWSKVALFRGRALFHPAPLESRDPNRAAEDVEDGTAVLVISPLEAADAGEYRCRVDFHKSPTRNSLVVLNVLEPPRLLTILNSEGAAVQGSFAGPYSPGDEVTIACLSSGGKPAPRVTWWLEHALLDDSFDVLADGSVRNTLQLQRLQRDNANQVYTCQASNSGIVSPLSATVRIQLRLPPLWVRQIGALLSMVAGTSATAACEVVGASPEPIVTWVLGGTILRNTTRSTSVDGNTTISRVTFSATPSDHGRALLCRVEGSGGPGGSGGPLQDARRLQVLYPPVAALSLGAPLRNQPIREGADVYLECHVTANPPPHRIIWKHMGRTLVGNHNAGIIVTNHTLVLQNVSRLMSGGFTCHAENPHGRGDSNPLVLDVLFSPYCASDVPARVVLSSNKDINITCTVLSNPKNNLTYTWKLIMASDMKRVIQDANHAVYTLSRKLVDAIYVNSSGDSNYSYNGTMVSCYARNNVGMQRTPCEFLITPAARPQPVHNCTVDDDASSSTLLISCMEAAKQDGVFAEQQLFLFELYDASTAKLCLNKTSSAPSLRVARPAGIVDFQIQVSAFNSEGQSHYFVVNTNRQDSEGKKHSAGLSYLGSSVAVSGGVASGNVGVLIQLTPLLGALVGTVGTLVVVAVAIVIMMRCKMKDAGRARNGLDSSPDECDSAGKSGSVQLSITSQTSDEKSMEMLPQFSDEEFQPERLGLLQDSQISPGGRAHRLIVVPGKQTLQCNEIHSNFGEPILLARPNLIYGDQKEAMKLDNVTKMASQNVYTHAPIRYKLHVPVPNARPIADQHSAMTALLTNQHEDHSSYNNS